MTKDPSLDRLIARLRADLGPDTFDIVDHWDGDRHATGFAAPRDHRVLAYVSVLSNDTDAIFVERELPPEPGSDLPYQTVGNSSAITYDELVDILRKHLSPP
jgi:hypothetical protein